ncbi:MAG: hypothetical protein SFV54_17855 [Bryobacteraceae bacterium]|nr:hypothetical protein [Bryobacteraceae bacterium]
MSDHALARPSLEQLKKQAKELLRSYRAGEESAIARFAAVRPPARIVSLADAQFVLARENGFPTWTRLKHHLQSPFALYSSLADDILRIANEGDPSALARVQQLFHLTITADQLRGQVLRRLEAFRGAPPANPLTLDDTRLFVARLYDFADWREFEEGIAQGTPLHKIDRRQNTLEPRPPLSARDWDELFDFMRANRITGLRAAGQMTDAVLERLPALDFLTSLSLEGSRRVTDDGLRHLSRLPELEHLNLSGCSITDRGLAGLRLPRLRRFELYHQAGITGEGLEFLRFSDSIERVELLGSTTGDAAILALAGKPNLRHLRSGNQVTDAGLALLHEIPAFKTWRGLEPKFALMEFDAEPTYLLLRGQITDRGLSHLRGLDGLFALNVDDSRLSFSPTAIAGLAALPHLGWLGIDATDETMPAIATLPALRMLMCQDTRAGDDGFVALSRSRTLEAIWGRRCHNLTGRGFRALATLPALRGLSVSCKNVDDGALELLPAFPALTAFMPMDVPDHGFRHVGRCARLEALWCMYCRDTGDAATEHIAALRLKTYYAGGTQITDRSLEILAGMPTLEQLTFWSCAGVTNAGVQRLAALPRLRELTLESMPNVTRKVASAFPAHVQLTSGT